MKKITLGSTNLTVNFNGFGALPVQRISMEETKKILLKAYENGISYFDTARGYTDSEEKIGYSLSHVRDKIIIATKTGASTPEQFFEHLNESLRLMKTDYIDIYQFHNPPFVPKPNDGTGMYEAMLQAKSEGKIRHIGFTNHRIDVAIEAVNSGLYEILQFPFSYLASEKEIELVKLCNEKNVGYVCMKALAGGLITNSKAAYAFLSEYDVLPIWGIQRENELDEFLEYQENPPVMTNEIKAFIEQEKKELEGEFCRGCGYCLPCPAQINIPMSARMTLLLNRAPTKGFTTEQGVEDMRKINNCVECDHCVKHCPYGLNPKELLKRNLSYFEEFIV